MFVIDEVIDRMIPVYDKYFTDDELIAMIQFYESPAGSRLLETMPMIMKEALRVSTEYLKEKITPQ